MSFLDIIGLSAFVLFMIFLTVGFNKQIQNKNNKMKKFKKDRNKNETFD